MDSMRPFSTYFNPRSREGSDRPVRRISGRRLSNFNPRSREGSDLSSEQFFSARLKFQSTLPRRERLSTTPLLHPSLGISIHAPAKGATLFPMIAAIAVEDISIHAPAKGATAKITKTIPNDFGKINNYNNSFA